MHAAPVGLYKNDRVVIRREVGDLAWRKAPIVGLETEIETADREMPEAMLVHACPVGWQRHRDMVVIPHPKRVDTDQQLEAVRRTEQRSTQLLLVATKV